MRKLMLIAAALVLCCVFAAAEPAVAVTYSPRCRAILAAQQAILEKYGITEDMNDYFLRITEEREDGTYVVRWYADPDTNLALRTLLGDYTAEVDAEGKVSVTWTHDGVSTEGGLRAKAWGAPQILLVMEEVRTEWEYIDSLNIAEDVAEEAGYRYYSEDEIELMDEYDDSDEVYGLTYDVDELDAIARRVVAECYPDAETDRLVFWDYDYPCSLHVLHGRPVAVMLYSLWGDDTDGDSWEWSTGDGYYTVTVNLENHEVEEVRHMSGLAGNG